MNKTQVRFRTVNLSFIIKTFHLRFLTNYDNGKYIWDKSLDDRNQDEIIKEYCSRAYSVRSFVSSQYQRFNDVDITTNAQILKNLTDAGLPVGLARHFAHKFSYNELYKETLDSEKSAINKEAIFDNFNRMVWQTVKLKPPSLSKDAFWRVEFRPMSIQPTDFENASFLIFGILLIKSIVK